MTVKQKITAIPHGVVFLYDPTMIIDVPEDTGSAPLLYTKNCITVWTIQEDDGDVSLTITDDLNLATGKLVFKGMLETEGQQMAFNDSGARPILTFPVESTRTKVSIFANDSVTPSFVTCLID